MDQGVNAVVLAKILGCSPGKVRQGNRLTYFTDVHVQIIEDWSRNPIGLNELTISMPGGKTTPFIRWNPPFNVGEEYLLFLRKAEEEGLETYFVPSPMSRYRISEGNLFANLDHAPIEGLDGRTVRSVKEEILSTRFSLDSFADVQPPSGWDTVVINPHEIPTVPSFSLQLPPGWEVHEFGWDFEGFHYSGELVGNDIRLTFIYGFFGGREAESYSIDSFFRHSEDISGEEATLIRPKGPETGPTVAYFSEFQGRRRRLRLTSGDLTEEQQRTAFAVFRSIKGMAGLLEIDITFGFHDGPIVEPEAPIPNVVVEVVSPGGKTQVGERQLAADRLGNGGWELHRDGKYLFWLNPGTYDIDIHFLEDVVIFGMPRRFEISTDQIIEEEMKVYLAQDSPEG